MAEKLIDSDGENRPVRFFLLGLEAGCKTIPGMKAHMKMCGAPYWPEWVETNQGHLPKAGQQLWLKHLFDLVPDKWQAAIDAEMVSCHLGVANEGDDPRELLNKIIAWNVQVALDPAVSEDARMLIERGKAEAALAPQQVPEPLTARELELIDGMIGVQLEHAMRCDQIANRRMAEKQKGWDMERVALLQKIKAAAPQPAPQPTGDVSWALTIDLLKRERDELLAVLKALTDRGRIPPTGLAFSKARAAIAKVNGGAA